MLLIFFILFFFFNDTATTEIYTLSLHDALPICLFGKRVQLEDGRTVIADENYVRESILNPSAKIVSGFKPIMPVFQGLVSEEQLNALIAYIKSLNQPPAGAAATPSLVSPSTKPQEPKE